MQNNETFTIVGITGSLNQNSYTRKAIKIALEGAKEISAAQVHLIDLREYQLAFCSGNNKNSNYPEGVFRLRQDVKKAHGILLGTPEYHGSFSGVLKNALDLMGFEEFEGKMVGLVGVSGGKLGAVNALNSLRNVGRALHAWVIPEQVSIAEPWDKFDENGALKDQHIKERLCELGRQVAKFAYLHHSKKALEFLQGWEKAPVNPGGM